MKNKNKTLFFWSIFFCLPCSQTWKRWKGKKLWEFWV